MLSWRTILKRVCPKKSAKDTEKNKKTVRRFGFLSFGSWSAVIILMATLMPYKHLIACVNGTYYLDKDNFSINYSHFPDVDQKRAQNGSDPGLPGNGGQYCVPSTTFNLFAYIANHGYPNIDPLGPNDWQSANRYTEVTNWISEIGTEMGTSASDGTTGAGCYNAITAWLPMDKFTVTNNYADQSYCPTVEDMTKMGLNGSIMSVSYAEWYEDKDSSMGEKSTRDVVYVRHGGHILTFTGSYAGFFSKEIYLRDPWSGDSMISQSTFVHKSLFWEEQLVPVAGGHTRSMCNLQVHQGVSTTYYLDGVLSIRPKSGFSLSLNLTSLFLYYPPQLQLDNSGVLESKEFPSPTGMEIEDVCMGPDLNDFYVVVQDPGGTSLWWIDIITGDTAPIDSNLIGNPKKVVLGRKRGLYVVDGEEIVHLHIDNWPPTEMARVPVLEPVHAWSYDLESDELLFLNFNSRELKKYDWQLLRSQLVDEIPPEVPLGSVGEIALDPHSDHFWIVTDASPSLYSVAPIVGASGLFFAGQIDDPNLTMPTSIQVDDSGHLFVCNEGVFLEFENTVARSWSLIVDSPFTGYAAHRMARVTTNRTNFDPATMIGPGYQNIEPDLEGNPVPDCQLDPDFLDSAATWPQNGILFNLILLVNDNCW